MDWPETRTPARTARVPGCQAAVAAKLPLLLPSGCLRRVLRMIYLSTRVLLGSGVPSPLLPHPRFPLLLVLPFGCLATSPYRQAINPCDWSFDAHVQSLVLDSETGLEP